MKLALRLVLVWSPTRSKDRVFLHPRALIGGGRSCHSLASGPLFAQHQYKSKRGTTGHCNQSSSCLSFFKTLDSREGAEAREDSTTSTLMTLLPPSLRRLRPPRRRQTTAITTKVFRQLNTSLSRSTPNLFKVSNTSLPRESRASNGSPVFGDQLGLGSWESMQCSVFCCSSTIRCSMWTYSLQLHIYIQLGKKMNLFRSKKRRCNH